MFKEDRTETRFRWEDIGDVTMGRPTLGGSVPVEAYRLMKYALRDVLIAEFDPYRASDFLSRAGRRAGRELCRQYLDADQDIEDFLEELGERMIQLKMGILVIEKLDRISMDMVLTVAEDLDCSGLPNSDETVCAFDEGLFSGVLEEYAGQSFVVKEVDCWANGDHVCRFAIYAAG
ncbi:MAG: 4-vinyl reductase [Deltaproteobacteria bacterium]|nr:4-vinyl reductase [Deltaproteobacteria bacterium]